MKREEQIRKMAIETTGLFSYRNGYSTAEDAFVAGAKWADAHPQCSWISVENRLPKDGETIIEAYTMVVELNGEREESENTLVSRYDGEFVCNGSIKHIMGGTASSVTHHWMPIPELPKEGE